MRLQAEALTLATTTAPPFQRCCSRRVGRSRRSFSRTAGAGMRHAFMDSLARELAQRDVATLRFQFPQAQADDPLPAVRGLVFVGFPLHPAGKPSTQRADHLVRVDIPMLFLQGTRDALAELTLVTDVVSRLGDRGTLRTFADADHAFHVRAKSGSSHEAVLRALADVTHWMLRVIEARQDA